MKRVNGSSMSVAGVFDNEMLSMIRDMREQFVEQVLALNKHLQAVDVNKLDEGETVKFEIHNCNRWTRVLLSKLKQDCTELGYACRTVDDADDDASEGYHFCRPHIKVSISAPPCATCDCAKCQTKRKRGAFDA